MISISVSQYDIVFHLDAITQLREPFTSCLCMKWCNLDFRPQNGRSQKNLARPKIERNSQSIINTRTMVFGLLATEALKHGSNESSLRAQISGVMGSTS